MHLGRVFMAFTLAQIKGNSLALSSAGMPPMYRYKGCDGSVEEVMLGGMPLGAMKHPSYGIYETTLEEGDAVLMLSDGLPEQKNAQQEMFDVPRVMQTLAATGRSTPEDIVARFMEAGEQWMKTVPQDDDITLLVIQKLREHSEESAHA